MTRWLVYTAVLTAAVVLIACGNTIDPFVDSDAHAFAVFGYLDMASDTQQVRVTRIRPPDAADPETDSPDVVSVNLDTGETVAWTDSLVTLDDYRPVVGDAVGVRHLRRAGGRRALGCRPAAAPPPPAA